jgi:ATP-dependent helicase YprA (DUF1998 family)
MLIKFNFAQQMIRTIVSQLFRNTGLSTNACHFGLGFARAVNYSLHSISKRGAESKSRSYYSTTTTTEDQQSQKSEAKQFDSFLTNPSIINNLNMHGLSLMFPIQETCFPLILEGRDILASDRTGSGKTLAYTLPVL